MDFGKDTKISNPLQSTNTSNFMLTTIAQIKCIQALCTLGIDHPIPISKMRKINTQAGKVTCQGYTDNKVQSQSSNLAYLTLEPMKLTFK